MPLISGRIKFDPDFYPDAPSVPVEQGDEYLQLVRSRCPIDEGPLLDSLQKEERDDRAWVSSDKDYGGIILEWGSEFIRASRIMSGAAAELRARTPERGEQLRAAFESEQIRDVEERLAEDLRGILGGRELRRARAGLRGTEALRAEHGFLESIEDRLVGAFQAAEPMTFRQLEMLRRPFRGTATRFARRPPASMLRRLATGEPLATLEGLFRLLG